MRLDRLWLSDFRNYEAAELAPSPSGLTVIHGANGDLTEMVGDVNRVIVPVVTTFGDVPEDDACVYLGSAGRIEVAVNLGSAAERFDARIGSSVKLKRLAKEA